MEILFQRLTERARLPFRATEAAAGLDLYATTHEWVEDGAVTIVPTGLAWAPTEPGVAGLILPRSGLATKGVIVVNSPGLVDADYRGEIKVLLSAIVPGTRILVSPGERIAQLLVIRLPNVSLREVASLDKTDRGQGGFGSTGVGAGAPA